MSLPRLVAPNGAPGALLTDPRPPTILGDTTGVCGIDPQLATDGPVDLIGRRRAPPADSPCAFWKAYVAMMTA